MVESEEKNEFHEVSGRLKRILFQDFGIQIELLRNPTVFTLDEYKPGADKDAIALVGAFFANSRITLLLDEFGPTIMGVKQPES